MIQVDVYQPRLKTGPFQGQKHQGAALANVIGGAEEAMVNPAKVVSSWSFEQGPTVPR